jgi:hypothetical protein
MCSIKSLKGYSENGSGNQNEKKKNDQQCKRNSFLSIVAFIINWPVQLGKIVDPSDEPVER